MTASLVHGLCLSQHTRDNARVLHKARIRPDLLPARADTGGTTSKHKHASYIKPTGEHATAAPLMYADTTRYEEIRYVSAGRDEGASRLGRRTRNDELNTGAVGSLPHHTLLTFKGRPHASKQRAPGRATMLHIKSGKTTHCVRITLE